MRKNDDITHQIDEWFLNHTDSLINDLSELIAIRSTRSDPLPGKPYGAGPAAALQKATDMLTGFGMPVYNFENRVITADIGSGEPVLGILAHLDTVGVGDGWDTYPFEAVVQNGKMFGRGTSDDKGPAVAAMYAMRAASELSGGEMKGCRVILGSAEETGCKDIELYKNAHTLPPMLFTPDADFPVINLEKGRFLPEFGAKWNEPEGQIISITGGDTANIVPKTASAIIKGFSLGDVTKYCTEFSAKTGAKISAAQEGETIRIVSEGLAVHAAHAQEGINAQTALLDMLAAMPFEKSKAYDNVCSLSRLFPHGDVYGKALGIAMSDEVSGVLTLNFGVLSLNSTGFNANFDSRVPISGTIETTQNRACKALEGAGFDIYDSGGYVPAHHTPEDSPLIKTLLSIYEDYTGLPGACIAVGGQTYVHGIPGGVAFGCAMPGEDTHAHGANEYISVYELILSAKMFTKAILDICAK